MIQKVETFWVQYKVPFVHYRLLLLCGRRCSCHSVCERSRLEAGRGRRKQDPADRLGGSIGCHRWRFYYFIWLIFAPLWEEVRVAVSIHSISNRFSLNFFIIFYSKKNEKKPKFKMECKNCKSEDRQCQYRWSSYNLQLLKSYLKFLDIILFEK